MAARTKIDRVGPGYTRVDIIDQPQCLTICVFIETNKQDISRKISSNVSQGLKKTEQVDLQETDTMRFCCMQGQNDKEGPS